MVGLSSGRRQRARDGGPSFDEWKIDVKGLLVFPLVDSVMDRVRAMRKTLVKMSSLSRVDGGREEGEREGSRERRRGAHPRDQTISDPAKIDPHVILPVIDSAAFFIKFGTSSCDFQNST